MLIFLSRMESAGILEFWMIGFGLQGFKCSCPQLSLVEIGLKKIVKIHVSVKPLKMEIVYRIYLTILPRVLWTKLYCGQFDF